MSNYLFEKEIRLFGLKRSGNGAVVAFLFGLFGEKSAIHLHNTQLTLHPAYGYRRGKVRHFERKLDKKRADYKYLLNTVEHLPILDISVLLKEGYYYDKERVKYASINGKDDFAREVFDILLIRSPHNNLASIIKKKYNYLVTGSEWFKEFKEVWLEYAKEAVGVTNYIPKKLVISFDHLVSSEEYRREISSYFGFAHSEDGIKLVGRQGSSFNGKNYAKSAQEMKVLDRWDFLFELRKRRKKRYLFDIVKEKLLDPEVIVYTKALFGVDLEELFDGS